MEQIFVSFCPLVGWDMAAFVLTDQSMEGCDVYLEPWAEPAVKAAEP